LHLIEPAVIQQSLEERLQPTRERTIDIGFKANDQHKVKVLKSETPVNSNVDVDSLPFDQLTIGEHFNVFSDLFMPGVYFYNTQSLSVTFGREKVHFGNAVCASVANESPQVDIGRIGSTSNAFNTLLMVNLEGSPFEDTLNEPSASSHGSTQLVHWLVANIPDAKGVEQGEGIVLYLPPVPFYGTGYHRIAFLLFRHKNPIDLSRYSLKGNHLADREFSTNKFFKEFEREITPSSLRFCQVKWHEECDKTLHKLGMKSPRYWYEWNEDYKPEQKEFPMKAMPFDLYLDMYRSPESVRREIEKKRIERLVREGEIKPSKYPDIFYAENKKKLPP
jgi:large subunit ribosomal protein L38